MAEWNVNNPAELASAIEGKSDDDINNALKGKYGQVTEQVMTRMREHFLPEKAGSANAVIQYDIKAPDAVHTFQLKVADGKCELVKGASGPARVTLTLSMPDFLRLVSGKLDGMQAFFSGKLKLSGDMMFAQTIQSWFKMR